MVPPKRKGLAIVPRVVLTGAFAAVVPVCATASCSDDSGGSEDGGGPGVFSNDVSSVFDSMRFSSDVSTTFDAGRPDVSPDAIADVDAAIDAAADGDLQESGDGASTDAADGD